MNNEDQNKSERVLLNLKTSQNFEAVLADLGQVRLATLMVILKIPKVEFFSMLGFRHYCVRFIILSTGGQDAPRHQHVHLAGPRSQELQSTEEHLLFRGGFHFGLGTCQGQVQPARLSKVSNLRRTSFILCNCCLLKAPGFCFTLIIGTQYSSPNVMSLY